MLSFSLIADDVDCDILSPRVIIIMYHKKIIKMFPFSARYRVQYRDFKYLRKGKSVRNVKKIRLPDEEGKKELDKEFEKVLSATQSPFFQSPFCFLHFLIVCSDPKNPFMRACLVR